MPQQMSAEAIAKLKDRIDDEAEAIIVLKGILKKKGLPLNTSYDEYKELEYKKRKSFERTYEESYCDRLFATARKKKQSSSSSSSPTWTPVVPQPGRPPAYVITYDDHFDERKNEFKSRGSVNGISYQDAESRTKRKALLKFVAEKHKDLQAPIILRPESFKNFSF